MKDKIAVFLKTESADYYLYLISYDSEKTDIVETLRELNWDFSQKCICEFMIQTNVSSLDKTLKEEISDYLYNYD